MSIRKTPFVSNEYYHVYNRGNSKQAIFNDDYDYYHFIKLLYLSNSKINIRFREMPFKFTDFNQGEKLINIGAYCLMPNHFHIIITQPQGGDISKFMQKITTAYSMYYNKKYKRSGVLFEGKFKSKHINNDIYFKYLFSYVHLNPVKLIETKWKEKGILNINSTLDFLKNYKYSSYLDYLGINRIESKILDRGIFPDYFLSSVEKFKKDIFEWLYYGDTGN